MREGEEEGRKTAPVPGSSLPFLLGRRRERGRERRGGRLGVPGTHWRLLSSWRRSPGASPPRWGTLQVGVALGPVVGQRLGVEGGSPISQHPHQPPEPPPTTSGCGAAASHPLGLGAGGLVTHVPRCGREPGQLPLWDRGVAEPPAPGQSPQPQRGETRLMAAQRNPILLRPEAASPAANEVPLISSLIASS